MRVARTVLLVTAVLLVAMAGPALAQTFVFGGVGEPISLDTAIIEDGISQNVTSQIYDTLVKYKGATTEVEAALAEKWEVSADGKVWTLHLRKGVKFHDGEPFDAAAVVWNFERWWKTQHPQHDNQLKAGQSFPYWEGQFDDFDDKSIVSDVKAIDPYTVRVTLKQPQAPFLANIAIFAFGIASPKAVEKWGVEFGKHPVGTGAFKFVEWKANQEVILDANPDYWGQKAKIKRLVVRNIKDNSARLAALKAGEIHGLIGINSDDIKTIKSDPNLYLLRRPANNTGYIAFNYHVKEFTDKRVRQAMAHADQQEGLRGRLLRRPRPGGDTVPTARPLGLQQGDQGLRVQPGQGPRPPEAGRLREWAQRDHLAGREEGAARPLVHAARAPVLPEPEGDRGSHRRRPRQGRHQGPTPDRRVGQLPREAEEGRDAPLHDRVDR